MLDDANRPAEQELLRRGCAITERPPSSTSSRGFARVRLPRREPRRRAVTAPPRDEAHQRVPEYGFCIAPRNHDEQAVQRTPGRGLEYRRSGARLRVIVEGNAIDVLAVSDALEGTRRLGRPFASSPWPSWQGREWVRVLRSRMRSSSSTISRSTRTCSAGWPPRRAGRADRPLVGGHQCTQRDLAGGRAAQRPAIRSNRVDERCRRSASRGRAGDSGHRAQYVPSVLDPDLAEPDRLPWDGDVRPVVTYLPSPERSSTASSVLERVMTANPDLRFIVPADETHALAAHSNVESLGWVTDMRRLYARAGCILRITEHDGLPRMLIEGLLRGMYAIDSWPMDGCWQARDTRGD